QLLEHRELAAQGRRLRRQPEPQARPVNPKPGGPRVRRASAYLTTVAVSVPLAQSMVSNAWSSPSGRASPPDTSGTPGRCKNVYHSPHRADFSGLTPIL